MDPAKGNLAELVVDVVEDSAWLKEELARDPSSASQGAVWFSYPLGFGSTASKLARQGTAQVSLALTTPNDKDGVELGRVSSKRRWLPARVLTRSSLARESRSSPAGCGDNKDEDGDAPRTHQRCCSAILSPCLAEALGSFPPSAHNETSTNNREVLSVEPRQLCVRELPQSTVALASAVELSGPYPVSSATGRLDFFGGSNGGQASKPAQQQAQLAAAVSSILPCALDGQVLAEGSIVRVASLFGLIVTEVWTERERRREGEAKDKLGEAGESQSNASTGRSMVKVHGSTELRLSRPTRSVPVGVAVDRNSSALTPTDSAGFDDAGPGAASLSPTLPPYSSPDAGEWIRRVEQEFGGLGDQVARAIIAVGSALRGGGRGRPHGRGGGLTAPASGLLLHGPTGVGKTLLARSIAEHSGAAWFLLDCASVFRRDRGKAEQYVQEFLNNAGACSPSVVVLDQIESVCRRRPEAAGITELQVHSVLLETMDRFRRSSSLSRVFFLATCPDSTALDPSLLQRGRLEAVLRLGALDSAARASVLGIHARGMSLELQPQQPTPSSSTDAAAAAPAGTTPVAQALTALSPLPLPRTREDFLQEVAARCHGYLGSDLERLCREAAMSHMSTSVTSEAYVENSDATTTATTVTLAHGSHDTGRRRRGGVVIGSVEPNDRREEIDRGDGGGGGSGVRLQDFWAALNVVRPASLVGMWGGDVGQKQQRVATEAAAPLVGCDAAMAELRAFVLTPLANPSLLRDLGLRGATGALLHGPPGCGKTSVARALAVEVQRVANFLEVRCSDLVDKVIGRSEKNVSDLFAAARAAAPCVLFLDQVEGVAARRGYHSSTEQTFDRILSTLLVEMDGVMSETGGHVVVLAATNDIERLDPALLRPGRLDRRVHLGHPDSAARTAIFLQRLASMPLQMEAGSVEKVGQGKEVLEGGDDSGAERDTIASATKKDAPSSGSGSGRSSAGFAIGRAGTSSAQRVRQHSTYYGVESRNDGLRSRVPPPRRRALLDSTEAYAEWLAGETEGSSGAHVTGVCREAALAALREGIGAAVVAPRHFEAVLGGRRDPAAVAGGSQ